MPASRQSPGNAVHPLAMQIEIEHGDIELSGTHELQRGRDAVFGPNHDAAMFFDDLAQTQREDRFVFDENDAKAREPRGAWIELGHSTPQTRYKRHLIRNPD